MIFKKWLGALVPCLIGFVAFILHSVGFTPKQIFGTVIFLIIINGTLFFWKYRLAFAMAGVATMLAGNLLNIEKMIKFAGLDIIIFLMGMMTFVGYLEEKHFFEYIIAKVQDIVGKRVYMLLFFFTYGCGANFARGLR